MTGSENPFAAAEPRRSAWASKSVVLAWVVTALSLVTAGVVLLAWYKSKAAHQGAMQDFRAKLDKAAAELANTRTALCTNQDLLVTLTNRIADLEKEREFAGQHARTLEDEMRQQLESKDVTISKLQGKLTVTILDRVMFDSGEAVLKPDGAAVMQKIADLLSAHPELKIHVIGHTDNVPIRASSFSRFASNWELSTARALAAVHYLAEKAAIDPKRLGAVGYGEFRPIADNATAEGRARNRRIAITILPLEATEDTPADGSRPSPTPAQASS